MTRPYDPEAIGIVVLLGQWAAKSPEERAAVLRDALDAAHAAGLAQGRAEMRAWLRNKADRTEQHGRTGFADLAAMVLRAAADDLDADTSEESERG